MIEYEPIRIRTDATYLYVCGSCGSLVLYQLDHDKWHEQIGKMSHDSQYARSMLTPIG